MLTEISNISAKLIREEPMNFFAHMGEIKKYLLQQGYWSIVDFCKKQKALSSLYIEYDPNAPVKKRHFNIHFSVPLSQTVIDKIEGQVFEIISDFLDKISLKQKIIFIIDNNAEEELLYQKNMLANQLFIKNEINFFKEFRITNLSSINMFKQEEKKGSLLTINEMNKITNSVLNLIFIELLEKILKKESVHEYKIIFSDYKQGMFFKQKKLNNKYEKELSFINNFMLYFHSLQDMCEIKNPDRNSLFLGNDIKSLIRYTEGLHYQGIKKFIHKENRDHVFKMILMKSCIEIEREHLNKKMQIEYADPKKNRI